jgi:hypothetical protein
VSEQAAVDLRLYLLLALVFGPIIVGAWYARRRRVLGPFLAFVWIAGSVFVVASAGVKELPGLVIAGGVGLVLWLNHGRERS